MRTENLVVIKSLMMGGLLRQAGIALLCLSLVSLRLANSLPVQPPRAEQRGHEENCQRITLPLSLRNNEYVYGAEKVLQSLRQPNAILFIPDAGEVLVLSPRGQPEGVLKQLEGSNNTKFCQGLARCSAKTKQDANQELEVVAVMATSLAPYMEIQLFLIDSALLKCALTHNRTAAADIHLKFDCQGNYGTICWIIHFQDHLGSVKATHGTLGHKPSRRVAREVSVVHPRPNSDGSGLPILVLVGVAVIGLVGLGAALALCAGSNTYEPQMTAIPAKKHSHEVAKEQSDDSPAVPTKVESTSDLLKNGTPGRETTQDSQDLRTKVLTGSLRSNEGSKSDREASPGAESSSKRSSRAQEPLPEIPKLEVAGGRERMESPGRQASNKNDEDEAGYAYARVPGKLGRMEGSDSEGEDDQKTETAKTEGQKLPPYGKVTKHSKADGENDQYDDSYTEVRETVRLLPFSKRFRSVTDPVEPSRTPQDKRTFTESATHLPLPRIPNFQVSDGEPLMYDTIPDDVKPENRAPMRRPKERLYESVDDMGPEDTYETVPDEIRLVDSPPLKSPPILYPPPSPSLPPRLHSPQPSPSLPPHLHSPQPTSSPRKLSKRDKESKKEEEQKKRKKKELAKTVSEGGEFKKKGISFGFGRKKAASVSAGAGKSRRDQQQPLPEVPVSFPTSPPRLSPPPPPNIPIPLPPSVDEDEDDVMYEQPDRSILNKEAPHGRMISVEEAKAKSQSLPLSRTMGGSVYNPRAKLPLPELPEDSGSGNETVVHKRRSETTDPNYDVVVYDEDKDENEPNYDTINREELLNAVKEEEGGEPGYERLKGGSGKADAKATPEGVQGDIKYGKVTKHASTGEPIDGVGPAGPEHDELGYAVIPAEMVMRKRAMSATKGAKPSSSPVKLEPGSVVKRPDSIQQEEEPGYESLKELGISQEQQEEGFAPVSPKSASPEPRPVSPDEVEDPYSKVEDPYSKVDLQKKHESRKQADLSEQTLGVDEDALRELSSSPNPPPVPVAEDLGDLSEFQEPPIPTQSKGIHELIVESDDGYSRVLKKPQAEVVDHPYASVQIIGSEDESPYATVEKTQDGMEELDDAAFGYDKVGFKTDEKVTEELKDAALGYASVDLISPTEPPSETLKDKALGYDTVGDLLPSQDDSKEDALASPVKSKIEQDTPTLESAVPLQPTYDRLEPVTTPGATDQHQAVGEHLYNLLEEQGRENLDEDRYEVIDEDTRLNLVRKQQEKTSRHWDVTLF